jgi:hypothetical protein
MVLIGALGQLHSVEMGNARGVLLGDALYIHVVDR